MRTLRVTFYGIGGNNTVRDFQADRFDTQGKILTLFRVKPLTPEQKQQAAEMQAQGMGMFGGGPKPEALELVAFADGNWISIEDVTPTVNESSETQLAIASA